MALELTSKVRKARIDDVRNIHALLLTSASEGVLLPRSLSQIYSHLRDFFVLYDTDGELIGCSALSIVWDDLAEVRSLLISSKKRGLGGGYQLVNACIEEAKELRINKVFALTYQVDFFERQNFKIVTKDIFPQKVWLDCVNCAKFPDCDETAVLLDLTDE